MLNHDLVVSYVYNDVKFNSSALSTGFELGEENSWTWHFGADSGFEARLSFWVTSQA